MEEGEVYLGRTSPVIEGLASWTLDQALDPVARDARPVAARCGVISTSAVTTGRRSSWHDSATTCRSPGADAETILCEEIVPLACTGPADAPQWLTPEEGERLLPARPDRNLVATAIEQQIGLLLAALPKFQKALEPVASERAAAQLAAHERVREAARTKGPRHHPTRTPGGHPRGLCPVAEVELAMARRTTEFQTIRSEGGLLPPDLLRRVLDPKEKLDGTRPEDYGLPQGERLNEVITQSWNRLRKHWAEFRAAAANLPRAKRALASPTTSGACRCLRELGFGLLPTSAGPEIGGRTYAINRFFGPVPIHLVGCGLSLDHRAAGVRGAAAANPHGLVQEFLNRSTGPPLGDRLQRPALPHPARQPGPLAAVLSRIRSRGHVRRRGLFRLRPALAHRPRHALRAARGRPAGNLLAGAVDQDRQRAGHPRPGRPAWRRGKALQILGEGFTSHPRTRRSATPCAAGRYRSPISTASFCAWSIA